MFYDVMSLVYYLFHFQYATDIKIDNKFRAWDISLRWSSSVRLRSSNHSHIIVFAWSIMLISQLTENWLPLEFDAHRKVPKHF